VPKAKPLQDARVLVAEDEPVLAFDIVRILMQAGAAVIGPALSVERALELANTEPVNCGVLDVALRDGLIFPVAGALIDKGAGILFYTGHADPEELKRDWPSAGVLLKPAAPRFLIQAASAVCCGR
jgi:two-component system, response regulator PdtaR